MVRLSLGQVELILSMSREGRDDAGQSGTKPTVSQMGKQRSREGCDRMPGPYCPESVAELELELKPLRAEGSSPNAEGFLLREPVDPGRLGLWGGPCSLAHVLRGPAAWSSVGPWLTEQDKSCRGCCNPTVLGGLSRLTAAGVSARGWAHPLPLLPPETLAGDLGGPRWGAVSSQNSAQRPLAAPY